MCLIEEQRKNKNAQLVIYSFWWKPPQEESKDNKTGNAETHFVYWQRVVLVDVKDNKAIKDDAQKKENKIPLQENKIRKKRQTEFQSVH